MSRFWKRSVFCWILALNLGLGQNWDISGQFTPSGVNNGCLKVDGLGNYPKCDPDDDQCCMGMKCIPTKSNASEYQCGNEIEQQYSPAYHKLRIGTDTKYREHKRWWVVLILLIILCIIANVYGWQGRTGYTAIE